MGEQRYARAGAVLLRRLVPQRLRGHPGGRRRERLVHGLGRTALARGVRRPVRAAVPGGEHPGGAASGHRDGRRAAERHAEHPAPGADRRGWPARPDPHRAGEGGAVSGRRCRRSRGRRAVPGVGRPGRRCPVRRRTGGRRTGGRRTGGRRTGHRRRRAERGPRRRGVRVGLGRLQVQDARGVGRDRRGHRRRQPVVQGGVDALPGQRGHDLGGRRTPRRVLDEAGADQPQQGRGYAGQVGLAVHDLVEQRGVRGRAVPEDAAPGRREGEHGAQREHVARRADVPARRLLRRHVAGRADHHAGLGHPAAVHGPRDAEVDEARSVGRQQDVGRLQVAVDQARRVDVLEGGGEAGGQRADRALRQRSVGGDHVRQVGPEDVRGGQPRQRRVRVGVHDGRGEPAGDRPRDLDLVPEAGPEVAVRREVGADHLHGDSAAAGRPGEVDASHATGAQPAQEAVGAQLPRVVRSQCVHGRPSPS